MIKILQKDDMVMIKVLTKAIIMHQFQYEQFKENLFIETKNDKRKVDVNDLSFVDFNLLYYKHKPNYADKDRPTLNIEFLLENYSWSTTQFEKA